MYHSDQGMFFLKINQLFCPHLSRIRF